MPHNCNNLGISNEKTPVCHQPTQQITIQQFKKDRDHQNKITINFFPSTQFTGTAATSLS